MSFLESLFFSRSQKRGILALTLFLVLVMLAMATYQLAKPEPRVRVPIADSLYVAPSFDPDTVLKVDINLADSAAWTQLRGIGPVLAQRIVKFRKSSRGFESVSQVGQTYGLSDSVFSLLRPQLFLNPITLKSLKKQFSSPELRQASRIAPMDINKATASELERLPGIGPVLSKRIVKYRESRGGFESLQDLSNVYQLQPEVLNQIKPFLFVRNTTGKSNIAVDQETTTDLGLTRGQNANGPIDLNLADSAALAQIPGISSTLAKRIVQYRSLIGFFYKLEQLRSVYGLQEPNLRLMRPHLQIGDVNSYPKGRLNQASAAQLGFLDEIDSYLANAIAEQREQQGGFNSWSEVASVPGLNAEALAELRIYYKL